MKKICTAICAAVLLTAIGVTMASAATPIHNLNVAVYNSTSVGVVWSPLDTGEPLYTVTCQAEGTDRATERRTYRTYCTINYLSPNTTYVVTVSTGSRTSSFTFTTPSPGSFTDYNYQLLDTGMYQSTRNETDYTPISALSAATLTDELGSYDINFHIRFRISATSKYKTLDFDLTLHLPNGDVYTIPEFVPSYGNSLTTVTEYYPINSALRRIHNDYGAFPTGEYTLTAYIDGGIAAETTFTVQ